MVITMHGDELLMVHFSEPEMHPTEGSSKRQKWQVRMSGTGTFPTVKPTMTSTPTSIWAFTVEFWGDGQFLRDALKPHLPVATLLNPELQGGVDKV